MIFFPLFHFYSILFSKEFSLCSFFFWFLRFLSFINIKSHSVSSLPAYQTCNSLNVLGALHWTRAWKNEEKKNKWTKTNTTTGRDWHKERRPKTNIEGKEKKNLWTKELLWCKCAPKCFFLFQRLFIRSRLHCKNNCWISIKWAILHCTKHINFWCKWVIIRFRLFCEKKNVPLSPTVTKKTHKKCLERLHTQQTFGNLE